MRVPCLQAIKAREEVVERLRAASLKVHNAYGGGAPVVLNLMDPLLKLFFRCACACFAVCLDVHVGVWGCAPC